MKWFVCGITASVIIGAATVPASAQRVDPMAGTPLTIDEAERRAMDLNPQVAEARLNIDAADFTLVQREAAFGTNVSTTFNQRGQNRRSTSQLTGGTGVTSVTTDTMSFGAGLSKPLEWGGGSFSLNFDNSRNASSDLFSTFNPSFSSTISTSYAQPLLRGFSIDQTRQTLMQARIDRDTTEIGVQQLMAQIEGNVRRAYWELVFTVEAIETARTSVELAEQQLEDNQVRLEVGTITQIDVLTSQAEVASRRQALVQAEGNWRSAQVALKQLIVSDTMDPMWSTTIVPTSRPVFEGSADALDLSGAINRALANRTDIEQQRRQADTINLNLRLLQDQRKPAMDFNFALSFNGIGGTELARGGLGAPGTVINPGGYLDALSSIGNLDFPTWTLGLNVSMPINSRASDAAIARSRVQQQQLATRLSSMELQIAAAITRIADQVLNAEQQLEAAAVARELSEQRLDLENARLDVGLSTTFFVFQAQRDLATAQNNELRALLNYRTSMVDFEQAQIAP